MAIISLQNVSIGFRGPHLLDNVSCQVEEGGRIGLLGRNGAGKSTLLKMLRGDIQPDHGTITLASGIQVAYLQQDVPSESDQTVAQVIATGLGDKYQRTESTWKGEQLVKQTLSQMELDGQAMFETHSSGMKRRVLLARATLVGQPVRRCQTRFVPPSLRPVENQPALLFRKFAATTRSRRGGPAARNVRSS